MARTLVTAPATTPVTVAELKSQLHIDSSDHDTQLGVQIDAAVELVEGFTGRSLINRTYDLTLDGFPPEILLPKPPAVSVTSIAYIDTAGDSQTLASSVYQVDVKSQPARVMPAYLQSWPSTRAVYNAVTLRWVAGYGGATTDIPDNLRMAVLMIAATWFENRTDLKPSMLDALPAGSRTLMLPFITRHG